MNPFKRFKPKPASVAADESPAWITSDLQRYFMHGFLDQAFAPGGAHTRLVHVLRELHGGRMRDGYRWEQKYPHTRDLRPSAGEYDDAVIDALFESDVPAVLARATGLRLLLAHVQIRVVFPGDSYMDWHRDTHYYGGRLTGSVPPMHKVIFYPAFGEPAPQLLIAPGSHRRVMPDQARDLDQVGEVSPHEIASHDDRYLIFDTSLLHAVVPEKRAQGSLRVIYAFGQPSQLAPFEGSRAIQDRYQAALASRGGVRAHGNE